MKKAAIIPAKSLGDALLMMIAAHHLRMSGYATTFFHPHFGELKSWFPGHHFESSSPNDLSEFEIIIAENDNSHFIADLKARYPTLSVFYPTYVPGKNPPLNVHDHIFDAQKPMADNIAHAIAKLLHLPFVSKENGWIAPESLSLRKHKERVLIHPTSSTPKKNWDFNRFVKCAEGLKKKGYDPYFAIHSEETIPSSPIPSITFHNLEVLSHVIFEAGFVVGNDSLLGHLASNFGLPTLIIADNAERMKLWRPDWQKGEVITPPAWLPDWKFLRKQWRSTISVNSVLTRFDKLSRSC